METFIIYIAKACGLIAVFLLAYHALLKKETFFNSNRWFLLAGLFTAVALPLIVFTKTVWIEPAPIADMRVHTVDLQKMVLYLEDIKNQPPPEPVSINWMDVLGGIYFAGVLLFLVRFVLDFLAIRRILSGNTVIKDGRFRLIDSEKAQSPFSFFNYIVYNSKLLKQEDLAGIIVHEKVHSSQRHSLDMIISQLFCIAFWFNPFMWLYKKSISQNLEFIADAGAMKLMEDKQAYQKTLLKITLQPDCIGLTNHFYQSLIKKRIVMLNKQQSKKWNSWKYAMVLPLLAAFMLMFQVKLVAQEKSSGKALLKAAPENEKLSIEINKDTKDSELEESKKTIKEEFNADVNYENVVRNLNSEITGIKVTVKDKGQSQVYEVVGAEPIAPFTIEVEKNNSGRNMITFGTGDGEMFMKAQAIIRAGNQDLLNGGGTANMENFMKDSTGTERTRIIRSFGRNDRMAPPMPPAPMGFEKKLKINNTDMLVVINGTKQKKGTDAINLPPGQEITEMKMLSGKEAKKKYGKEAKEGAIEITTRPANNMAINIGPEAFDFTVMPMDFDFDMPMDFDIRIEDFENMSDMLPFFKDGNMEIYGGPLSDEDMKRLQEELKKSHAELQKLEPMMQEKFRMREMSEDELKATKDEIEKAKKEIEQSRKEVEQARKELEKARKELNKKA